MSDKFTFRDGTLTDAAEMARIYNHYVATSEVIFSDTILSDDDMRAKLKRLKVGTRFPFLIAEAQGRVAGYAYAHLWQPDPVYAGSWELTMYLDHECRGLGIGTVMLQRLVDQCRLKGAHVLISCITEGNEACERMCRRAGFTHAGTIPHTGYKFGRYLSDAFYYRLLETKPQ